MTTMGLEVVQGVAGSAASGRAPGDNHSVQSGRLAVYVGRSAGSGLYHHLLAAKRSVVAMAPYIKPLFARRLVEAAERGVDVVLVTSEDAARRPEVVATLVEQTRHTSRSRQRWRRAGLLVSALLVLSGAAVGLAITAHGALLYASYAVPAGVMGFLGCRLVRVHSYGYRFRLPRVRVIVSPYCQEGAGEGSPLMVHAKVYVIDGEVAYLPSFNLTPEGFFDNFESCVRIDAQHVVRGVVASVEALFANKTLRVLDAAALGRSLYAEPRY